MLIGKIQFNNNYHTKRDFQHKNTNSQPAFSANLFKRSSKIMPNKMLNTLKNLFEFIKDKAENSLVNNKETPFEISNNNKFISRVQKILNKRFFSFWNFKGKNEKKIIITKNKEGNTTINYYSPEGDNLIRSIILDKDNSVLKYNSAYPWRIFEKNGKNYKSQIDIDEYAKDIASDPLFLPEMLKCQL